MQSPQAPMNTVDPDNSKKQEEEKREKQDRSTAQKIETIISDRPEPDKEVSDDNKQDEPGITPTNSVPDGCVHIDPQTAVHGNIFQAFGAPCYSHDDVSEFCENIQKRFPATKTASSFMVVYSFNQNGKQTLSFRNDGEKGAGQKKLKMMVKMME